MKITKNVEAPKIKRGNPKYDELMEQVVAFYGNDDEFSMNIECDSVKEGRSVYASIYSRCKSAGLPLKVWSRGVDVYITKRGA